jgi:hypothetical protein
VVVQDLPLSILLDVDETVPGLDLVAGVTHCEFVDTTERQRNESVRN